MRNYLSKKILSTPSRRVEHAAWDFLIAIRELFPERFAELQAIADDIRAAEGLTDEDDPRIHGEFFGADYEELHASVKEWAERHRISCEAIDTIATEMATGRDELEPYNMLFKDKNGKWVDGPSPISARPYRETLNEFLALARKHYAGKIEFYRQHGLTQGPLKRERAHFRWLARRLVGGQSWAQIAVDDNPLRLSEKSIASEARKTALLIGLPFPRKRGPRPGSHRPARQKTPRRR